MIAVIGEALIDLLANASGSLEARPGGGPYNTARTIGRLGVPVTFAGRLADDSFGLLLRAGLAESGVAAGVSRLSAAPTTLAVAGIGSNGSAEYQFYLEGTSAADLEYRELLGALPPDLSAVHVGTLGLVLEPIATSVSWLVAAGLPACVLLMVDPNCRPAAITARATYLIRLTRLIGRADILKASVEDLAYISPGQPSEEAAKGLLSAGARLVLVTDGPRPARAFLGSGDVLAAEVPEVEVADAIGAGDAFGGAFLAWWSRHGLGPADLAQPDLVGGALCFAADVAARTCTRIGADPPRAAELPQEWRILHEPGG
ncbi:MAG: carbohydrate kinase [Actinomycetia bacterium]|nr:carbohydrate kinase [Actinomycetes bacterium]